MGSQSPSRHFSNTMSKVNSRAGDLFTEELSFRNRSGKIDPTISGRSLGGWPAATVPLLHPLTKQERRVLSDQIRSEVVSCAVSVMRKEQDTAERLQSSHVKCVCLLILAAVVVGGCMLYLRNVLVPFVLALFFMFMLEPLLLTMVSPPRRCLRCLPKGLRPAERGPQPIVLEASYVDSTGECLRHVARKVWLAICMLATMLALIGAMTLVVYFLFKAIENFPWDKYAHGKRMKLLLTWFPEIASDAEELTLDSVTTWLFQGPFFNALDITLNFASQTFLTLLFLMFFLAYDASLEGKEPGAFPRMIRNTVTHYIQIKTMMAFFVAVVMGLLYWAWAVDLWFMFALFTFVLYYIPHVGNTIAILLPLPLVFLDPDKTAVDLIVIFSFPFLIHQMATNLVDAKLLADKLDLHPITVLLSLAFWTSLWGPVGAFLSVPLTAVARSLLSQVNHPYTQPLVNLLQGDIKDLSSKIRLNNDESISTESYGGFSWKGDIQADSLLSSQRSPRASPPANSNSEVAASTGTVNLGSASAVDPDDVHL